MIKVLNPGFYSTIQDFGRPGYQHLGVPCSGAMDKYSIVFANRLLGNNDDAAVIEMTMTGTSLEFNSNTHICISGAEMSPKLNDFDILQNKCVSVKKGDLLTFGILKSGFRCYLAVNSGISSEKVLNSRSLYKGITKSHKLKKGDLLSISEPLKIIKKNAGIKINEAHFSSDTIDVFKGPEFDKLTNLQVITILSKLFTISKNNNRMGYQLEETLENTLSPIITSPVLPGTIQLTPSGKLIILMRDCQTTGGYPRVLQLKESSINVLAQKYTGKSITFKLIDE